MFMGLLVTKLANIHGESNFAEHTGNGFLSLPTTQNSQDKIPKKGEKRIKECHRITNRKYDTKAKITLYSKQYVQVH